MAVRGTLTTDGSTNGRSHTAPWAHSRGDKEREERRFFLPKEPFFLFSSIVTALAASVSTVHPMPAAVPPPTGISLLVVLAAVALVVCRHRLPTRERRRPVPPPADAQDVQDVGDVRHKDDCGDCDECGWCALPTALAGASRRRGRSVRRGSPTSASPTGTVAAVCGATTVRPPLRPRRAVVGGSARAGTGASARRTRAARRSW